MRLAPTLVNTWRWSFLPCPDVFLKAAKLTRTTWIVARRVKRRVMSSRAKRARCVSSTSPPIPSRPACHSMERSSVRSAAFEAATCTPPPLVTVPLLATLNLAMSALLFFQPIRSSTRSVRSKTQQCRNNIQTLSAFDDRSLCHRRRRRRYSGWSS